MSGTKSFTTIIFLVCAFLAIVHLVTSNHDALVEEQTAIEESIDSFKNDTHNNAPERIEEDDPRWDCETMGNGDCGNDTGVELPSYIQDA